jgi:hypothetical protein
MRRRALRVRFVKPFTPLGNWSSRSSTSRVRVRTVSHNQGGIGRVMDIGFYHRSIDAELLAIFQIEFHGGLHYESIDGCQRGRGEPVEGTVESIVLGHGVTVELRKGAQCEAIVDAIAQVAVVLTRMRTNERKVCSGVMPRRPESGFFRPRSRSLRTSSTRSACCFTKSAIRCKVGSRWIRSDLGPTLPQSTYTITNRPIPLLSGLASLLPVYFGDAPCQQSPRLNQLRSAGLELLACALQFSSPFH